MYLTNHFKFLKPNKIVGNRFVVYQPQPNLSIRTNWTVQMANDLHYTYSIDAENELIAALSEELRREIDNHIINELNIGIEIGNQLLGRSSKITNFKFFN